MSVTTDLSWRIFQSVSKDLLLTTIDDNMNGIIDEEEMEDEGSDEEVEVDAGDDRWTQTQEQQIWGLAKIKIGNC